MKTGRKYITDYEKLLVLLSFAVLFIITLTYLLLFGESVFFYQENRSLFIFSDDYLQMYSIKPGGILVYAGNFLTQFYYDYLLAAIILTVLLLLLSFVFLMISKKMEVKGISTVLLVLLPSCILLLLQTRNYFYIHYILGFLLTSLTFFVTIVTKRSIRLFVVAGLIPVLYYITGSFILVYLGMYLVYTIRSEKGKHRLMIPLVMISFSILTFLVFKEIIFLQPADHLVLYPLFQNDSKKLTTIICLFSVFFILIPFLLEKLTFKTADNKRGRTISMAAYTVFFTVIIFLLSHFYDRSFSGVMKLEKMVYNQDWNAVIKKMERDPSTDIISQYYYNLALSEKNQLCERLFFVQQNYGPMSLALPRDKEQSYRTIYYYYAIGLVKEAHHLAYELMVKNVFTPENFKMLVKTELINGNYKVAARYINMLKKTIYYKSWAEKYEKMLFRPELINSDPELGQKARLQPPEDFYIAADDATNIELLLLADPSNKIAFEYKLARLLLEKDILAVADEVKKMKQIGYIVIPRHIEEAVERLKGISNEIPDLGGLEVSNETKKRYLRYGEVFRTYGRSKSLLEKNIKKAEKNTFWYYLQFGIVNSDFYSAKPENNSIY